MKILQLTSHYPPSIGGVETHLQDLVNALIKKKYKVFVLTYRPLHKDTPWKLFENSEKLKILRIPWVYGFFYKLVEHPALEFIYLFGGLFLVTPLVLIYFRPKVIHTHGLIAMFSGVIWGKIFGVRIITSVHSIYNFPNKGLYRQFSKFLFNQCDKVLSLSRQSSEEMKLLGVDERKVEVFTYWVDLKRFKKIKDAKKDIRLTNKFVVLFVGRLVKEKGIIELLASIKYLKPGIKYLIAGVGPLESRVKKADPKIVKYLGGLSQNDLPIYYSASDLLIVPSVHEEGFGRVIIEALACGCPVLGANRGAIPEAINSSVGRLIEINPRNIAQGINDLKNDKKILSKMKNSARNFAVRRYSEDNIRKIIETYCD